MFRKQKCGSIPFHNKVSTYLCIPFGTTKEEVKEAFRTHEIKKLGNSSLEVMCDIGEMDFKAIYSYSSSSGCLKNISISVSSSHPNLSERYNELLNAIAQKPYCSVFDSRPHRNSVNFRFGIVEVRVGFTDLSKSCDDKCYVDFSVETHEHSPQVLATYPLPLKLVYDR